MTGPPTTPSYPFTNGTKTAQIRKPKQYYYLPKVTGLVEDTMRSKLCSSCLQNPGGQPRHQGFPGPDLQGSASSLLFAARASQEKPDLDLYVLPPGVDVLMSSS